VGSVHSYLGEQARLAKLAHPTESGETAPEEGIRGADSARGGLSCGPAGPPAAAIGRRERGRTGPRLASGASAPRPNRERQVPPEASPASVPVSSGDSVR
jgi:hypothetical protein